MKSTFKARREQIIERSLKMRDYLDDTPVEIPPGFLDSPPTMEEMIKAAVEQQLGNYLEREEIDQDDEEDFEDTEEPILSDYQIDLMAVEEVRNGYEYEGEQQDLAVAAEPLEETVSVETDDGTASGGPKNGATPLDEST